MTNVKKLLTSAQYRPYTAYNIFFQLEREFILQSILHVTPSVDTLFDQAADDVIPMLPQKYQEIVLSDDWYIPGKGQRKKRKHRKSHGKISFSDLSKKVATSWHKADGEVKLFCAEVSDILMQAYKKALYRQRKDGTNNNGKEEKLLTQPHNGGRTKVTNGKKRKSPCNTMPPSQVVSSTTTTAEEGEVDYDQIIISSATSATVTPVPCTSSMTTTNASDALFQITSWPSVGQLSLPLPSYQYNYCYFSAGEVDIDDDAIMNMWAACD